MLQAIIVSIQEGNEMIAGVPQMASMSYCPTDRSYQSSV